MGLGLNFWVIQTVNGLAFSTLLFLLAVGFTLIFGLMRIMNLTHGSFYLLGAYISLTLVAQTGNFVVAILGGGLVVALVGVAEELSLLRRFHGRELEQVLLTMALWFIFDDAMLVIWGGNPHQVPPPPFLNGPVTIGGISFPKYHAGLIGIGIIVALCLWLLTEKTKMGAIIRAGADNETIARAMGIDVDKAFIFAFALGSFLAGLGGVMGGPVLGVDPSLSGVVLPLSIAVVIVGGLGSLKGALAGALFVGLADNFGRALFPEFAYFTLFVPMVAILAFRPQGLFGRA